MGLHTQLAPSEAADRLAIRELVDAYAFCDDRRDAEGQMALFRADTRFIVFMDTSYCLAHHVSVDGEKRTLMVASIRYLDTFVKQEGARLFDERKLMVDWTETRSMNP